MKSLSRRDLLTQFFSKDVLKNIASAYREFSDASDVASRISCDEAGHMLRAISKRKRNNINFGKEG